MCSVRQSKEPSVLVGLGMLTGIPVLPFEEALVLLVLGVLWAPRIYKS